MAKKFWFVADWEGDRLGKRFDKREEAEECAREYANSNADGTYYIAETVAVVQQPKPPVEITAL